MAYASQTSLRSWWAPACSGPFTSVALHGAGRVMVRSAVVEATRALNQVLISYNYLTRYQDTGAYNCRKVTGGSTYSLHAYGIAMDINWTTNPYSSVLRTDMFRYGDGQMPRRIEAIRTNDGAQVWRWGGWFSGNKDAMHYEITCAPSNIRSGINWKTVYGGTISIPTPPPTTTTGDVVYRIHWFKGEPTASGNQTDTIAAYRVLSAHCENRSGDPYLPVSAWWIANPDELKVWRARGLKEFTTPLSLRGSIEFFGGPFDNTKTP